MSKEFQRIKERSDVRKHLFEFIGNSIPRAVSLTYFFFYEFIYIFLRIDISLV